MKEAWTLEVILAINLNSNTVLFSEPLRVPKTLTVKAREQRVYEPNGGNTDAHDIDAKCEVKSRILPTGLGG